MSFEGFYQYLCKNGHYHTQDCWYDTLTVCPDCQADIVWSNMVDETNGSYEVDSQGNTLFHKRIDDYVELKKKYERQCDCCGTILETTYEIPKKKRNKK